MTGRHLRRAAVVLASLGVAMGEAAGSPAAAGWSSPPVQQRTGTVSVAVLDQVFRVVSGPGSGGDTYSAGKVLGTTTVGYVDLVNTGTVPLLLTGTVSLDTFLGTTVTIVRCTTAWSGGACPGTTATVMSAVLSTRAELSWQPAPVPAAAAVRLKVTVGGSVGNRLTLTAAGRSARTPGDRTSG